MMVKWDTTSCEKIVLVDAVASAQFLPGASPTRPFMWSFEQLLEKQVNNHMNQTMHARFQFQTPGQHPPTHSEQELLVSANFLLLQFRHRG